jgi:glycerol kinase
VGVPASGLVADGGASDNLDLMGRQAGILGLPIQVSANPGLSALGAAYAAGVGAGIWSMTDLESMPREYINVEPSLDEQERRTLTTRWRAALDQSMARS